MSYIFEQLEEWLKENITYKVAGDDLGPPILTNDIYRFLNRLKQQVRCENCNFESVCDYCDPDVNRIKKFFIFCSRFEIVKK